MATSRRKVLLDEHATRQLLLAPELSDRQIAQALGGFGLRDVAAADRNLQALAAGREERLLLAEFIPLLLAEVADCAEPDRALNNIERIAAVSGNRLSFLRSLRDDPAAVHLLAQLVGASQAFAETLIRQPLLLGWLRHPEVLARPVGRRMAAELRAEIEAVQSPDARAAVLRRFKRRHMLRIGAMDLLGRASLGPITAEISALADAEIDGAIYVARQRLAARFEPPREAETGRPIELGVIGLGKLGGNELNYSSDIDLLLIYGAEGTARRGDREVAAREYFAKLAEEIVRALDQVTDEGHVFRVDMRLRPEGSRGELVLSLARTLRYYRNVGRTWERQALIKARPVAGNLDLGRRFIAEITPFVYRRYLTLEAIGEIRQLKSQMELAVHRRGQSEREVKEGVGGIRDVEFTVQFFQLLHGGENPTLRATGTLPAIERLREAGCLTLEDARALATDYEFLRSVEHRLQTMHELPRHTLPASSAEQAILARQLGFRDQPDRSALELFRETYRRTSSRVRAIFERLFGAGFEPEGQDAAALVALILSPHTAEAPEGNPEAEAALARFGFSATRAAHRRLMSMARENSRILNTPRTRISLAQCAPTLFAALQQTPDPDRALRQFERIVDSIGAKAVFYQTLAENSWLLKMTVELAVYSEFLTDLLVRHPGMLDELVDSLQTGRAKDASRMRGELDRLLTGAVEIDAILKGYQAGELLRIGVRDLLHEADLQQTRGELSDLAEVILGAVTARVLHEVRHQAAAGSGHAFSGGRFAVIGLGKLGGREMTYGSDLDLVYVCECEEDRRSLGHEQFARAGRRITKILSGVTEFGTLYGVDLRLRPTGKSGPLVVSLSGYRDYARSDLAFWERLTLTRTRFVAGDAAFGALVAAFLQEVAFGTGGAIADPALLSPEQARAEVAGVRRRIEQTVQGEDLKRGPGGLVDVEFIVQMLQVLHGKEHPALRTSDLSAALTALREAELLEEADFRTLKGAYRFLRTVESRLRIVHGTSVDRMPAETLDLELLARQAGPGATPAGTTAALLEELERHTRATREVFARLVGP